MMMKIIKTVAMATYGQLEFVENMAGPQHNYHLGGAHTEKLSSS